MSMRWRVLLALIACALFEVKGSGAAERTATASLERNTFTRSPSEPPAPRIWYGWQTLTLDGVSLAALGTGLALFEAQGSRETVPPQALLWTGLAGSLLGAPIVHFSHGKVGRGFGSFGLRLSAVVVFALGQPEGGRSEPAASALGLGIFASAIILDATAFGYTNEPRASLARWSISAMSDARRGLKFVYRF